MKCLGSKEPGRVGEGTLCEAQQLLCNKQVVVRKSRLCAQVQTCMRSQNCRYECAAKGARAGAKILYDGPPEEVCR